MRKFGIKNETFCFFYLTIIIIFVAKLKNFIGNFHLNKRLALINIYIFREMDIHFICIAATQDIYLDIWRNIKNQPS